MDAPPSPFTLTTVLSLLATLAILLTAYGASLRLLPTDTSGKLRGLYIWHLSDALCHFILEGAFLYNCFFTFVELPAATSDYPHPASLGGAKLPHFLGHADRSYGAAGGNNPSALLWQEYARADKRWAGADLGIVSLELLTVFLAGPCAMYISELIRQGAGGRAASGGRNGAKLWFWATVLATGELYGGFMTFAPEWLSGNTNLDGSNPVYLWLYLFFFNTLWVFIPIWVLYEAYSEFSEAFIVKSGIIEGTKKRD